MEQYRIFIVEDDAVIAGEVSSYLTRWGYEVACAQDFRKVLTEFAEHRPHLVLLDIGLPFYSGHYWCGQIRQISQVPIIFVSSASDNMNIVMAVNMGGDDFVAKPFDLEVLSAKVQALLRRAYAFRNQTDVCEYNGLILDLSDASLLVNGQKLELTRNEFRIMQLLLENGGKPVSREAIMKRLWDNDCFVDDNTLTVNMTRLRKKMESVSAAQYIQTRKGLGYMVV
ncbi:MAG: response regulator transcription factor [Lachnospiraceae bacterium]|nr:response regulator transcription factor [Lachnospiraceae bacterium]MCM1237764.1 response regulator transcription factor [Lachnospiraceae bacterium]MCM1302775.1 response regulator transcription factor [Butyrivibrio sp.]MCM1342497.1 response regulator transcription factor [Muribaculaceae bacterium]MCM1409442.1 response regulator transcription factor [Lachnospiraceae bacterium]